MGDAVAMAKIKSRNFNIIIDYMINRDELAISQIADDTQLSIPTVKKFIDYAIENDIVIHTEIAESTGGRKPKLYKINRAFRYTLYIAIDNNSLCCRAADFANKCIYKSEVDFVPETVISDIKSIISDISAKYKIKNVCISLPSIVDSGKITYWGRIHDFDGYDLKADIEKEFNVNCIVENDMKLTAYAAIDDFENPKDANIATMQFGHNGIGLGVISNGKILKGATGFAGEVSFLNSFNIDIPSVDYCARLVNGTIVFTNPEIIVFYTSEYQNNIDDIMKKALKKIPDFAVPKIRIADSYIDDVFKGLTIISKPYRKV